MAARSKAWVCGRLLPGTGGSNPAGFCCEFCVLSGSLCDGPIPRPEKYYGMCVIEYDPFQQQPSALTVSR